MPNPVPTSFPAVPASVVVQAQLTAARAQLAEEIAKEDEVRRLVARAVCAHPILADRERLGHTLDDASHRAARRTRAEHRAWIEELRDLVAGLERIALVAEYREAPEIAARLRSESSFKQAAVVENVRHVLATQHRGMLRAEGVLDG